MLSRVGLRGRAQAAEAAENARIAFERAVILQDRISRRIRLDEKGEAPRVASADPGAARATS